MGAVGQKLRPAKDERPPPHTRGQRPTPRKGEAESGAPGWAAGEHRAQSEAGRSRSGGQTRAGPKEPRGQPEPSGTASGRGRAGRSPSANSAPPPKLARTFPGPARPAPSAEITRNATDRGPGRARPHGRPPLPEAGPGRAAPASPGAPRAPLPARGLGSDRPAGPYGLQARPVPPPKVSRRENREGRAPRVTGEGTREPRRAARSAPTPGRFVSAAPAPVPRRKWALPGASRRRSRPARPLFPAPPAAPPRGQVRARAGAARAPVGLAARGFGPVGGRSVLRHPDIAPHTSRLGQNQHFQSKPLAGAEIVQLPTRVRPQHAFTWERLPGPPSPPPPALL